MTRVARTVPGWLIWLGFILRSIKLRGGPYTFAGAEESVLPTRDNDQPAGGRRVRVRLERWRLERWRDMDLRGYVQARASQHYAAGDAERRLQCRALE